MPSAAGVGVVDEQGLEDALLVRHQEMVHDTVAEVGGEDFAGFGAIGDEADGTSLGGRCACAAPAASARRFASALTSKARVFRVCAFVAAALTIVPPQRCKGVEVRADHQPPRTARTRSVLFLSLAFTLPSLKFTFHAFDGLFA